MKNFINFCSSMKTLAYYYIFNLIGGQILALALVSYISIDKQLEQSNKQERSQFNRIELVGSQFYLNESPATQIFGKDKFDSKQLKQVKLKLLLEHEKGHINRS